MLPLNLIEVLEGMTTSTGFSLHGGGDEARCNSYRPTKQREGTLLDEHEHYNIKPLAEMNQYINELLHK